MKKIILFLFILSLPVIGFCQNGMGDLINLQFGLYGVERVSNLTKHTNVTGYYYVMPEILCIIDTVWWMPGKKPAGVSVTMHTDTLSAGIPYLLPIKSIKLSKGRCLLYKNKP